MLKFLLVRFSSMGDVLLTTPLIRCIKQQIPNAEIHFITKPAYADLLRHNPYTDRIHLLETSVSAIAEQLKGEGFDYIIDLHKNIRSLRLRKKLKTKYYSFEKLNLRKWIYVNFKSKGIMPSTHLVDRYFEGIKSLGVKNDGQGLDFFFPPDAKFNFHLPESFQSGYLALVIGAALYTKRIPLEKLIEICQILPHPIVLIGGEEEKKLAEELISILPNKKIISFSGTSNLFESAALLRDAEAVITGDTGMMHLAAALNKPILSIWGSTTPLLGMYPYYAKDSQTKNAIIQNEALTCRPCSKIGFQQCPKKHFKCMKTIDVHQLQTSLNMILKKTP